MKGNILRMLNESEKRRIVGMHTSHKNQKLDDEAKRLSKLFGYRINESAIRGYLITEAVGGPPGALSETAEMTAQIDMFLRFDSMPGVVNTIKDTLDGSGALCNITSDKMARLLFYGLVKSQIANRINQSVFKFAPNMAMKWIMKRVPNLGASVEELNKSEEIRDIANNIIDNVSVEFVSQLSTYRIAQLNKGKTGGVLTKGVITPNGFVNFSDGRESKLEDIVMYLNSYNLSNCAAIWGSDRVNEQYYYDVAGGVDTDGPAKGQFNAMKIYSENMDNLAIDIFCTKDVTEQTAQTTGSMKAGYTVVKEGDRVVLPFTEAYEPGKVGPTEKTLKDAVEALNKIFADKNLELTGVEIQGTADVKAFNAMSNTQFAEQYNVAVTDVPPTNLIPAKVDEKTVITTQNRLTSGNAWLAYQRGKLYADALKKQLPNMPDPVVSGLITAAGTREVRILLNIKKKDENIVVPAEYIMKTIGTDTSTTDLAGQYKIRQCYPYFI